MKVCVIGIRDGASMEVLSRICPHAQLVCFDNFGSLPEDASLILQPLDIAREPPLLPYGVEVVGGLFRQTMPDFATREPTRADLVLIDCDRYQPTACCLRAFAGSVIAPGTAIIFRNFLHHCSFLENQMLAFYEMLQAHNWGFEWFATDGRALPLSKFATISSTGCCYDYLNKGYYQTAAILVTDRLITEEQLVPLLPEAHEIANKQQLLDFERVLSSRISDRY